MHPVRKDLRYICELIPHLLNTPCEEKNCLPTLTLYHGDILQLKCMHKRNRKCRICLSIWVRNIERTSDSSQMHAYACSKRSVCVFAHTLYQVIWDFNFHLYA